MPFQRPTSNSETLLVINAFVGAHSASMPPNNFDQPFLKAIHCTSAHLETSTSPASAVFSLKIPATYTNNPNPNTPTVQGGAIATMMDDVTSIPIVLAKNHWGDDMTGLTRNLNLSYIRSPREGETVVIETEVVQCGRRLATIRGVMKRASDGVVLVTCQHDKARPDRGVGLLSGHKL